MKNTTMNYVVSDNHNNIALATTNYELVEKKIKSGKLAYNYILETFNNKTGKKVSEQRCLDLFRELNKDEVLKLKGVDFDELIDAEVADKEYKTNGIIYSMEIKNLFGYDAIVEIGVNRDGDKTICFCIFDDYKKFIRHPEKLKKLLETGNISIEEDDEITKYQRVEFI